MLWSFLPYRRPFDPLLLFHINAIGCSLLLLYKPCDVSVWRRMMNIYLFLLVPSNFSNSRKKYYYVYSKHFCHCRYNKNILMTEKATGYTYICNTPLNLESVAAINQYLFLKSPALGFKWSKIWKLILIVLLAVKEQTSGA